MTEENKWSNDWKSTQTLTGRVIKWHGKARAVRWSWQKGMRLHAHSRGQGSVALSSCEAEVMAASEGIKEALLLQEMLMCVGLGHYEIEIKVDSSAAHAFFHRRGVGRMKHIDSRILWLQDLIAAGDVRVKKIPRTQNLADMLTHTHKCEGTGGVSTVDESQELQWTRQRVDGHETTNGFPVENLKVYSHGWGGVLNSIVYSSHARHVSARFDCSCVVRWVFSIGQEW